jgi:hypothetical protein
MWYQSILRYFFYVFELEELLSDLIDFEPLLCIKTIKFNFKHRSNRYNYMFIIADHYC